ncbi:MAG: hypothetical protein QXG05_04685 [Nitrososphaerota archaeon]
MSERRGFVNEIRQDISRYRDALKGILGDVYSLKPELAPKLHLLISKCDGVIAMTQKMEADSDVSLEAKERIGKQVADLKMLTESFLQELSDVMFEENGENNPYKGAAG